MLSRTRFCWLPSDGKPIRDLDPRHHAVTHPLTVREQLLVLRVRPATVARQRCLPFSTNTAKDLRVSGDPGDAVTNHEILDASPSEVANRINQELFIMANHAPFGLGHGDGRPSLATSASLPAGSASLVGF